MCSFFSVSLLLSTEEVFFCCDHSSAGSFFFFCLNSHEIATIVSLLFKSFGWFCLCDYVPEINRPTSSPYYYGERAKVEKKNCILITSNLTQTSMQLIAPATTKIATMKRACNNPMRPANSCNQMARSVYFNSNGSIAHISRYIRSVCAQGNRVAVVIQKKK